MIIEDFLRSNFDNVFIGNKEEIDLTLQNTLDENKYPALCLIEPYSWTPTTVETYNNVRIILANWTEVHYRGYERTESVYKPVLLPFLAEVEKTLKENALKCDITNVQKVPYYISGEKVDDAAWDALILTVNLTISNKLKCK